MNDNKDKISNISDIKIWNNENEENNLKDGKKKNESANSNYISIYSSNIYYYF